MGRWIKGRQGEELSEVLRNSTEPDGHNNGKAEVDDAGTAHAFMAAKEEAMFGDHGEAERHRKKKSWRTVDYTEYALRLLAEQAEAGQ